MTGPSQVDANAGMSADEPRSRLTAMSASLEMWLRRLPGWEVAFYVGVIALAVFTRFWDLGTRAIHHDESIHAFFALDFLNAYQHNPLTHGPFQFFGLNLFFNLFGESEVTARGLAAVFGVVLVGLPFFLRSFLGRWACMIASLMLLLSPTILYFTRFARNDAYMAVWTLGLAICLWKYTSGRKARYLYGAAALFGMAFATKESTFILMVIMGGFFLLLSLKAGREGWETEEEPESEGGREWRPRMLRGILDGVSDAGRWLWPRIAPYPLVFTLTAAWVVAAILWSFDIYDVFGRVNPTFSLVSLGVVIGVYAGVLPWLWMLQRSRLNQWLDFGRYIDTARLMGDLRRTPWLLLVLLALPLTGAAAAIFQEPLGLTLANPNGYGGGSESHVPGIPDGAPSGNVSLAIAVGIVIYLFAASIFIGLKWERKKFLISSIIFWSIFAVLFTTFFTNTGQGLGSGLWQSLGYWVAQQEVRRGAQPWYYYLIMTATYEFLALVIVLIGGAWLLLRQKAVLKPGLLLYQGIFWAIAGGLILYTYWMPENPDTRFIIGAMMLLGAVFVLVTYGAIFDKGFLRSRLLIANVAALLLLAFNWAAPRLFDATSVDFFNSIAAAQEPLNALVLFIALSVIAYKSLTSENKIDVFLIYWLASTLILYSAAGEKMPWLMVHTALPITLLAARFVGRALTRVDWKPRFDARLAVAAVAILAVGLVGYHSVRVGVEAAYGVGRLGTGDYPIEMLVYTQTTPDITRTMANIEERAIETGLGYDLPIIIDRTSGFGYPWRWYLRDYESVQWPCYDANTSDTTCASLNAEPEAEVIVMHYRNEAASAEFLDAFGEGERIGHRAWFPEFATYKSGSDPLPLDDFVGALGSGDAWGQWWDFFLYRELAEDKPVGSEDSIVFFRLGPVPFEQEEEE